MSRILVIAGTDSSGGAGLSRDIAMAESLGCSVSPVVTAVTVQTNTALIASHPVPPEIIAAQIQAAFDVSGEIPKAVKIGMIGAPEAALHVLQALPADVPVVLDPVLKSSSGGVLMSLETLAPLLPRITLLTPNLEESARLSNRALSQDIGALEEQANILLATGLGAVLIKGGHATGETSLDHLFWRSGHKVYAAPRIARSKRGTGCSLATAITCGLAKGEPLEQACSSAKLQLGQWFAKE
ncbi:bifunctional hydroxymethylpyrimidine kinase/phosphomethylpyrimidine kinase [Pseudophaeobacter leonis]|uniref:bifunctional hydroxymethylpyrimidine kinase/phosphomethylpyrimidine kinase n=1 Tax=Pseudophaeobacter leonis TaxID=1144477 RepID=UPI0009F34ED0|nr:hydroxymethylpyrimidine/phosphomethylpyrimidine kinase [Pseudophaeobacter leonis]